MLLQIALLPSALKRVIQAGPANVVRGQPAEAGAGRISASAISSG